MRKSTKAILAFSLVSVLSIFSAKSFAGGGDSVVTDSHEGKTGSVDAKAHEEKDQTVEAKTPAGVVDSLDMKTYTGASKNLYNNNEYHKDSVSGIEEGAVSSSEGVRNFVAEGVQQHGSMCEIQLRDRDAEIARLNAVIECLNLRLANPGISISCMGSVNPDSDMNTIQDVRSIEKSVK